MSVNIIVVCSTRPDLQVCERLARFALRGREVEWSAVWGFEPADGLHEFVGQHVLSFDATTRQAETYLATFVLASATAILYEGRVIDEAAFFPRVEPARVLLTCLRDDAAPLRQVWASLVNS
jgi:hypothetical protein